MAPETESTFGKGTFPIQAEADASGVVEQSG